MSKGCFSLRNVSVVLLYIVRNLIAFQIMGLYSKTEALFQKMINEFFVGFCPYFTLVKFLKSRSPLRSPQWCILSRNLSKKRKIPYKSKIYQIFGEIISIISLGMVDLNYAQLLR